MGQAKLEQYSKILTIVRKLFSSLNGPYSSLWISKYIHLRGCLGQREGFGVPNKSTAMQKQVEIKGKWIIRQTYISPPHYKLAQWQTGRQTAFRCNREISSWTWSWGQNRTSHCHVEWALGKVSLSGMCTTETGDRYRINQQKHKQIKQ